jgi:hypothetical protein
MTADSTIQRARALIRQGLHLGADASLTDAENVARRRRRVETLIYFCWGLIVLKSFVVVWAVNHYSMPFNPLWVIGPTVTFALVATTVYYWLRE